MNRRAQQQQQQQQQQAVPLPPPALAVQVPQSRGLSVQDVALLVVRCAAEFLLYDRGLTPCSVEELAKVVAAAKQQQQSHRRLPSAVKRCAKLLDELDQALEGLRPHLDKLLAQAATPEGLHATVALAFGSAPARPREVYRLHLHLPSSSASASKAGEAPSAQLHQHYKASIRRQLVRGLLQQHAALAGWERQLPGGTKMHVLVLMPASPVAALPAAPTAGEPHSPQHSAPNHTGAGDPTTSTLEQLLSTLADASTGAGAPSSSSSLSAPAAAAPFAPRPHLSRALAAETTRAAVQLDVEVFQAAASSRPSAGGANMVHRASGHASGRSCGAPPASEAAAVAAHHPDSGHADPMAAQQCSRERAALASSWDAGAGPADGDGGGLGRGEGALGRQQQRRRQGEEREEEGEEGVECLSTATAALSLQQVGQVVGQGGGGGGACVHHNGSLPEVEGGNEVEAHSADAVGLQGHVGGGGAAAGAVWWQCRTVIHGIPVSHNDGAAG